jgi:hypothetical protein
MISKRTFYRSIHSIPQHLSVEVNRTGSGTSHLTQFVKEQGLLSSRQATVQLGNYSICFLNVKH